MDFCKLIEFVVSRIGRRFIVCYQNALSRRLREIALKSDIVNFRSLLAKVGGKMKTDAIDIGKFDNLRWVFHTAVRVAGQRHLLIGFHAGVVKCHVRTILSWCIGEFVNTSIEICYAIYNVVNLDWLSDK